MKCSLDISNFLEEISSLSHSVVFLPPIEEQNAIVEYVDRIISETNAVIAAKKEQISTLEAYKKSVIFEYVTGKKEVV